MKEMDDLYKVGEKHSNNWQVTEIFEGTNETFEHRRYQTGKYFWFRLYESYLFPYRPKSDEMDKDFEFWALLHLLRVPV